MWFEQQVPEPQDKVLITIRPTVIRMAEVLCIAMQSCTTEIEWDPMVLHSYILWFVFVSGKTLAREYI